MAGRIRWNSGARVLAGLLFALVAAAPAAPAAAQEGVGIVVLPFARGAGVHVDQQYQVQIAEKLSNTIVNSKKLKHLQVVEHSRLEELFYRQRIEAGGRYTQKQQSEIAGLLRARYILVGTIEKAYLPPQQQGEISLTGLLDSNLAQVRIEVGLVDPNNGFRKTSWITNGNARAGASGSLAKATQEAVKEIVERMEQDPVVSGLKADPAAIRGVRGIVNRPEPEDDILIKAAGVVPGGRYLLVRVVDERDASGKVFFTDRKPIGIVQVTEAQAEGAKLKVVTRTGESTLAKEDVIELLAPPAGR